MRLRVGTWLDILLPFLFLESGSGENGSCAFLPLFSLLPRRETTKTFGNGGDSHFEHSSRHAGSFHVGSVHPTRCQSWMPSFVTLHTPLL